ncbi:12044_t:CDS:1, partial [Dentiscutata heterogama]
MLLNEIKKLNINSENELPKNWLEQEEQESLTNNKNQQEIVESFLKNMPLNSNIIIITINC